MSRHPNHPENLLECIYEHHVLLGIVATRMSGVQVTAWEPTADGGDAFVSEVAFAKSRTLTIALRSVLEQLMKRRRT